MKKILLSAFILVLASCSSSKVSENTEEYKKLEEIAKKDHGYLCEKKASTGSRIGKKKCSSSAQREARKDDAERALRNSNNSNMGQMSNDRNI
ncbi:MAG: hypothetical protein ACI9LM_003511 [Alteromonadaceae bacterium]|jgi:hypothetical protein